MTSKLGGDSIVSALPPDRIIAGAGQKAKLNLFLYLITPHSGLRQKTNGSTSTPLASDGGSTSSRVPVRVKV